MTWASLVLTGLKIVMEIFTYLKSKELIKEGEDKAIAAATLVLLERTESGKRIREHVRSLSDADAESLWERMLKQ